MDDVTVAAERPTSKRRGLAKRSVSPAVWGWYAVAVLRRVEVGGSTPGLVLQSRHERAFWAAWWTEDPRLVPGAPPDDFGIVDGQKPLDQAVGLAYDALRRGRGPRVYDMSIGASYALAAYREGAPVKRVTATDFDAQATKGYEVLGLGPEATVAEARMALRKCHPDRGGDEKVDMAEVTRLYKAVIADIQRREAERVRAAIAAGTPPPTKRRKRLTKEATEQTTGLGVAATDVLVALDQDAVVALIRRVATRVRKRAEEAARLCELHESLAGFCMVGALGLVEALKEVGLGAIVVGGRVVGGHYWAEIPLPEVLPGVDPGTVWADVTATQFGPRWAKVVVLPPGAPKRKQYDRYAGGAYVRDFLTNGIGSGKVNEQLGKLPKRWWADPPELTADHAKNV